MTLQLQSFTTLVQNMAAAVQSAAASALDMSIGSVGRAILEANASVVLWLQWLLVQVLQMARASTSTGADLDSWMADFSVTRLPASSATGAVTFSRITPGLATIVPTGAVVRTADASQSFTVAAVPSAPNWSADGSGYTVAATASSIDVPVTAVAAGSAGNVQAGTITQLATAIPGIDAVTNGLALTGGRDAESDAALRARFLAFIQSRSLATPLAVSNAVTSVQQGLSYAIAENVDAAGNSRPGNFVVTVNDGSGNPSSALLAAVQAAIDAVRPVGSTFMVRPPAIVAAAVQLSLATASGSASAGTVARVVSAITTYTAALGIGEVLSLTRIAQLAYGADSSITNVTGVTINGSAADLAPPAGGIVQLQSATVS